jgi:RHS repeat-associated protein
LTDGATTLVNYAYLGMRTVVQTTYPQPSIQHTLLGSSGGNSPAGDIYWGLDLFGRIVDSRWYNTGTSADLDRIKYGYDRASNRIWRQNPVATAAGASFDEHYSNDGLERLKDMQRGTLNGTNTAITSPNFAQCWTLDPTGNWRGFNESTNGSSWTLNQTRTANTVNEITGITNTASSNWVAPAYDAAGNMTTMPQPGTPTSSYGAIYDAWNRLVTITDAGNNLQKYQYDARNFRTQILTYTAGVLSETRHCYFTSGWRNIEERVDAGTTAERQFVWGVRYIDDLVLRDRSSERLYAMQDANWNVTSIANSSATTRERYAYSAYGYPSYFDSSFVSRANSSFTWETLYCGYRYDRTPRLYCVRFRAFHAVLGNWCRSDPLQYTAGHSLYTYGGSTPYSLIDPYGLEGFMSAGGISGLGPVSSWNLTDTAKERILDPLEKALAATCISPNHCISADTCDEEQCKKESHNIALAIYNAYKWNSKIAFPRMPWKVDNRVKGYLCWEWAWAFMDAFASAIQVSPATSKAAVGSKCFRAKLVGSEKLVGDLGYVHFWLKISSTDPSKQTVYVDDGFARARTFVHTTVPDVSWNGYLVDPDLINSYPRTSCDVPGAPTPSGKRVKQ